MSAPQQDDGCGHPCLDVEISVRTCKGTRASVGFTSSGDTLEKIVRALLESPEYLKALGLPEEFVPAIRAQVESLLKKKPNGDGEKKSRRHGPHPFHVVPGGGGAEETGPFADTEVPPEPLPPEPSPV